jgi:NAD(P)H-dependent FMN reductase
MPATRLQLAVIVGSTREGRFGDTVARWFAAQTATRPELLVDVIDVAELDLPATLSFDQTPALHDYAERVDRADAFVVVTPEYNHSFPASLKHAIDLLRTPWQRKPVAFVSYGGLSGGLRAVEQLRLVFAELYATTVRETVSFHGGARVFDDAGEPLDAAGAAAAAKVMLDDLVWWASALRTARDATVVDEPWEE